MHISRTYSTKATKRRALSIDGDVGEASGSSSKPSLYTQSSRKKQRIEVEVVSTISESDNSDEDSLSIFEKPASTLVRSPTLPNFLGLRSKPSISEKGPASNVTNLKSTNGLPQSKRQSSSKMTARMSPRKQRTNTNDASTSNGSGSPTKLTAKMLGRSHTEPSVGLSTTRKEGTTSSIFPSTSRKPISPSKSLPSSLFEAEVEEPSSSALSARAQPRPPPVTHARTYGGASRSYLVALPTPDSMQADEDDTPRESYSRLRERWGIDRSEEDIEPPPQDTPSTSQPGTPSKRKGKAKTTNANLRPAPLPYGMMNDLRSITELRSKGESRRFLDEVGYLFEGLEPDGPIGLRRASAIEIVTKLCEEQFARKAKAADFLPKTWDVLHAATDGRTDRVLDLTLVTFVALVARDPSSLEDLVVSSSSGSRIGDVLFEYLGVYPPSKDGLCYTTSKLTPAELKRQGISMNELNQLKALHKLISSQSSIFDLDIDVSTKLLLSHSMAALSPSHISSNHLPRLLATLKDSLKYFDERLEAYCSGLSLSSPTDPSNILPSQLLHTQNCLSLLESYSLDNWSKDADKVPEVISPQRYNWLPEGLLSLSIVCEIIQRHPDARFEDITQLAITCSEVVSRVMMSLTHDDPEWCRSLLELDAGPLHLMRTIVRMHAQNRPTSKASPLKREDTPSLDEPATNEPSTDSQASDRLCLALALLTNLVQGYDGVKDVFGFLYLEPDCKLKRSCVRSCSCPNSVSSLNILSNLYVDYLKPESSSRSLGTEYLSGHLSILLGMLMQRSKDNQTRILALLPGSTDRNKLAGLIEISTDFTAFYKALMVKLQEAGDISEGVGYRGDQETNGESASPATPVARRTREAGEKIDSTVKEIIAFLETLKQQV
ncbi:hypothetical protein ONZ45_g280 [Pleurotus djamor]|nr:hypothetical protein ONZ45_g280 [Pleurotus djamor]